MRGRARRGAARRRRSAGSSRRQRPLRLRAAARLPRRRALRAGERVVERAGEAARRRARPRAPGARSPPARAREAYHEARCALEARELGAPAANGAGRNGHAGGEAPRTVATYRDLGSFQLLLSLQDSDALRLFCESLLGPIEHGEGHYGGELMRSLEAFIECNGQWEAAARRLYCHRHTLRYRIRKVEELTGRDLGIRPRPHRVLARAARARDRPHRPPTPTERHP